MVCMNPGLTLYLCPWQINLQAESPILARGKWGAPFAGTPIDGYGSELGMHILWERNNESQFIQNIM
jgi:hypothetical protein